MRLEMLFEARDPSYEKEVEPHLQKPIRMFTGKKPADYTPDQNAIPGGLLSKAVRYHEQNFNGARWPALEAAFLNRKRSFTGGGGDYVRPRTTLFRYLKNINEPWPDGEALVAKLEAGTKRGRSGVRHIMTSPNYVGYLEKKDKLTNSIVSLEGYANYYRKTKYGTRWTPFEDAILKSLTSRNHDSYGGIANAVEYLRAIKGQWPEGTAALRHVLANPENIHSLQEYLKVNKWPEGEAQYREMLLLPQHLSMLLQYIVKNDWPEGEASFRDQLLNRNDEPQKFGYFAPYFKSKGIGWTEGLQYYKDTISKLLLGGTHVVHAAAELIELDSSWTEGIAILKSMLINDLKAVGTSFDYLRDETLQRFVLKNNINIPTLTKKARSLLVTPEIDVNVGIDDVDELSGNYTPWIDSPRAEPFIKAYWEMINTR